MTLGKSFGPMKIRARTATMTNSVESTPNMPALYGLGARVVVSRRRRRRRLFAAWSDVDRLLITGQPRRFGPALLLKAPALVVFVVGHAFLEAFHALCDVFHHVREAVAAEQQKQEQAENDPMNEAEAAH